MRPSGDPILDHLELMAAQAAQEEHMVLIAECVQEWEREEGDWQWLSDPACTVKGYAPQGDMVTMRAYIEAQGWRLRTDGWLCPAHSGAPK